MWLMVVDLLMRISLTLCWVVLHIVIDLHDLCKVDCLICIILIHHFLLARFSIVFVWLFIHIHRTKHRVIPNLPSESNAKVFLKKSIQFYVLIPWFDFLKNHIRPRIFIFVMIQLEMACFLILNSNFFLYYYFEPYVKHSTFEIFPLYQTRDWYLWKLAFMSIHLLKVKRTSGDFPSSSDSPQRSDHVEHRTGIFRSNRSIDYLMYIYLYIYIFEFSFSIWRISIRNVACLKFCYALVNKGVL
jgi:hypothetical protein